MTIKLTTFVGALIPVQYLTLGASNGTTRNANLVKNLQVVGVWRFLAITLHWWRFKYAALDKLY